MQAMELGTVDPMQLTLLQGVHIKALQNARDGVCIQRRLLAATHQHFLGFRSAAHLLKVMRQAEGRSRRRAAAPNAGHLSVFYRASLPYSPPAPSDI